MIFSQTLGIAQIDVRDGHITPIQARKFGLLLYLGEECGRRIPRGTVHDLIFPDQPEQNARHSIRELAYQLRNIGVPLCTDRHGIELISQGVGSDHRDLVASARVTAEQIAAASGGFLPGYAVDFSEALSEWLQGFSTRVSLDVSLALLKEVDRAKSVGDWTTAQRAARACLALTPLNEEATLALAESLAMGGGKLEAVKLLDEYVAAVGARSPDLRLPASLLRRRIGERPAGSYESQAALRFIGRDAEMLALRERFLRAVEGESQCVTLVGEPGIGKSRLALEFSNFVSLGGARVERVSTQPHDVHRPMGAFVDLVPQLLTLPGAIGCSPESMAALKRLTTHESLGAPTMSPSAGASEVISSAIFRAIGDLIDALVSENTLVLVVEDVHWIDEMSMQMLVALVSSSTRRSLFVVLTSREQRRLDASVRHAERETTLALPTLPVDAAGELVRETLASRRIGVDESLQSWIVATSAGNPFFLSCLMSHLERTGEQYAIPETVHALLDQRLNALSAHARLLMEICVALGNNSTTGRLVAVTELPHYVLVPAMKELESGRLVEQSADLVQAAHALIVDRVQQTTSEIATRLVHGRIAGLLESEARAHQSPGLLWDCADHWMRAGDAERSIRTMRECANHALDIGRPCEASELLLRAAESVSEALSISLIEDSIRIAGAALEHPLVLRGTDRLRSMGVRPAHDELELAELAAKTVGIDSFSETILRLQRCVAECDASVEHRLRAGLILLGACEVEQTPTVARQTFHTLEPLLFEDWAVRSLVSLTLPMIFHASFGDVDTSTLIAEQLFELSASMPAQQRSDARRKVGFVFLASGRTERAAEALQLSYADARSSGLFRMQLTTSTMLGSLAADTGDDEAEEKWMRIAENIVEEFPTYRSGYGYQTSVASFAVSRGDISTIQRILKLMDETGAGSTLCMFRCSRALRAYADYLTGRPTNIDTTIHELTENIAPGENGQSGDFEIEVLLRIAKDFKQPHELLAIAYKYLTVTRTDRFPLAKGLTFAIRDLQQRAIASGEPFIEVLPLLAS